MNRSSLIVLATTVVPALLLLVWGVRFIRRARASLDWPVVAGTITESRVLRQGNTRSPRVSYGYVAAARPQVGYRLWVGPRSISASDPWADRVAARYPVGAAVQVAVDPNDPAYAVLEAGPRAIHWLPVAVAALFVAVTGFMAVIAI